MDERARVEAFVASSAFPMEFAVADRLRAAGFTVHRGRTYKTDQDGRDSVFREIDMIATVHLGQEVTASLIVECKRAASPWIVAVGETDPAPDLQPIMTRAVRRGDEGREADIMRTAFSVVPPHAFALTALASEKGRDRDPAFDAIRQVVSAAMGARPLLANEHRRNVLFPMLVVEGHLWRYLGGDRVEPCDRALVVWWGEPAGRRPVLVEVVNRDRLDDPLYLDGFRRLLVDAGAKLAALPIAGAASF